MAYQLYRLTSSYCELARGELIRVIGTLNRETTFLPINCVSIESRETYEWDEKVSVACKKVFRRSLSFFNCSNQFIFKIEYKKQYFTKN